MQPLAGVVIRAAEVADGFRLTNGEVELVASTSYGPRILRYAFVGGANLFGFVDPTEQANPTPFGDAWHIYGGHRLWHAPEDPVRTYVPDNAPVRVDVDGGSLVLTPQPEAPTGLAKELRLTLEEEGTRVRVEHRITNGSDADVELAVWALSLMARGGTALLPSPPFAPHPEALLPSRRIVTWPYTWLGDPRFRFGQRFTRVDQDPTADTPQKLGMWDADAGWAAYVLDGTMFVKHYDVASPSATYVDLGCNVEVFTNATFLELETLGALVRLGSGASAMHVETWDLFRDVELPADDDALAANVLRAFDKATDFPRSRSGC